MEISQQPEITGALVELIRRAATDLPADMEQALTRAKGEEETGSETQRHRSGRPKVRRHR